MMTDELKPCPFCGGAAEFSTGKRGAGLSEICIQASDVRPATNAQAFANPMVKALVALADDLASECEDAFDDVDGTGSQEFYLALYEYMDARAALAAMETGE